LFLREGRGQRENRGGEDDRTRGKKIRGKGKQGEEKKRKDRGKGGKENKMEKSETP